MRRRATEATRAKRRFNERRRDRDGERGWSDGDTETWRDQGARSTEHGAAASSRGAQEGREGRERTRGRRPDPSAPNRPTATEGGIWWMQHKPTGARAASALWCRRNNFNGRQVWNSASGRLDTGCSSPTAATQSAPSTASERRPPAEGRACIPQSARLRTVHPVHLSPFADPLFWVLDASVVRPWDGRRARLV